MPNSSVPITAGSGTGIDTYQLGAGDHRQIVIVGDHGGYEGRAATFRIPGRAAATQNLSAIHNATGSTVVVDVRKITVDILKTAVGATLTDYVMVRVHKFTAVPTNGTALTKVAVDSGSAASSASVTVWQDAASDGNGSATTLTLTLPANTVVTEEIGARLFTAVGYEPADRMEFLAGSTEVITLRPLEGLAVVLVGTTTGNPITNFYTVTWQWEEYAA